ncbi:putative ABC transport system permease protein [Catalinimonas alkaloidigena]|uniref:Putative ABC transport system permease protein n=1 Tax=Catalinimonas alkaloidigena TaxID=1075417 RepID=A0A1G8X2G8_9BACT|nr:ABC transporter permease [Catalinimonas alkaloidigena]SDJ84651.1 putative ABC transport system permease protein [Catalinimonas alkaloidigena]
MLRNYLKVAFRTLRKQPAISLIHLVGLTLGLTFALVLGVVVRYELSFDQFHSQADRIYRVVRVSAAETEFRTGVSFPVPDALRADVPSLEAVTAMLDLGGAQIGVYGPNGTIAERFQERGCAVVDSTFFEIFDFQETGLRWRAGNPATALAEPFAVVLTETLAQKYFPDQDALGKSLRIDNQYDLQVTGVVSDFPANTDLPFTVLISHATLDQVLRDQKNDWYGVSDAYMCFVRLREGTPPTRANAQIKAAHARNVPADLAESRIYRLQPLSELHTDPRFGNYNFRTVPPQTLWTLALVGAFILLMACINFINLSTARAVMRAREVGLRKALGGARAQLVGQFMLETFLLVLPAALLSLLATQLVLAQAVALTHVEQPQALWTEPWLWRTGAGLVAGVTLLAGFYPSLVLSGFSPIRALKKQVAATHRSNGLLRRSLVTLQFFIALVFVMGTLAVVQQMRYFRNFNMGFNQESVLLIKLPRRSPELLNTLRNQWSSLAQVQDVTFSMASPAGVGWESQATDIRRAEAPPTESLVFQVNFVDDRYLPFYEIPLVAGRNFRPTDSTDSLHRIILNETLTKALGFSSPADALGQELIQGADRFTIIGVIQDYHTQSLHQQVGSLGLMFNVNLQAASLRLAPGGTYETLQATLAQAKAAWQEAFPEYVFDYSFLDKNIASYYREETRLSTLFNIFTGVAIFIACLGLLGLASYTALQRTKEIGIRKVLGASVAGILVLLSKDYLRLLLIAFVVAVPVANYFITEWLQSYPYQIPLSIWLFAVPGIGVLLMALLTIGAQSMRAAQTNPVDSLRQE